MSNRIIERQPSSSSQKLMRTSSRVFFALAIIAFVSVILSSEISAISFNDVLRAFRQISLERFAVCAGCTAVSFSSLAAYDVYAAKAVSRGKISWKIAAFAGATSNAVSNTLGFHALTGGALRFRIYAKEGISAGNVARIVALAGGGIFLSFICILAFALLFARGIYVERILGIILSLFLVIFLFWLSKKERKISIWKWSVQFPTFQSAGQQMIIGLIEMSAAIGALYILLPLDAGFGFMNFCLLYVTSIILGIVTCAPGGIGVFEATMLTAFPVQAKAGLLAALLLYRLIFNILPFCIALFTLAFFEVRQKSSSI